MVCCGVAGCMLLIFYLKGHALNALYLILAQQQTAHAAVTATSLVCAAASKNTLESYIRLKPVLRPSVPAAPEDPTSTSRTRAHFHFAGQGGAAKPTSK